MYEINIFKISIDNKADNRIIMEQPIEEPKQRGRPTLLKVEQSGQVERRSRGRPNIDKPPKEPQKRGKQPKPQIEPVERRPRGRPRIYRKGTIGKPKDFENCQEISS